MAFRHPQVSIDGHDLVLRIPTENIPNFPVDQHRRTLAVQAIQAKIADWMHLLDRLGVHPAAPSHVVRARLAARQAGPLTRVR